MYWRIKVEIVSYLRIFLLPVVDHLSYGDSLEDKREN